MPETIKNPADAHKPQIDFDLWSDLAKNDPEAFEAKRKEHLKKALMKIPAEKRERARCLQWKIDQVRDRAETPMAACVKISEMMWDSLVGRGGLSDALKQISSEKPEPLQRAKILSFSSTQ